MKKREFGFPLTIARFLKLQGGPYDDLTLVATSRDQAEIRLGDDYVVFSRKHVEELREALQCFLEFEKKTDEEIFAIETVEVTPARVTIEEAIISRRHVEAHPRRRGRHSA